MVDVRGIIKTSLVAGALASVAAIVVLRVFFFEPFRSPSAAMLPTLHEGDQFFVSKAVFHDKLPRRGDVIVVRLPETGVAYVKRVIGLPGDVVVYDSANDAMAINGEVVRTEPLGAYAPDPTFDLVRETIDGRSHSVLRIRRTPGLGGTYRVPAGSLFLLGDNRDNSRDSRHSGFGFVPTASVVGTVGLIWWNSSEPLRVGIVPQ